ncbi:N-acetyltransferase [Bacteroidia bacterium]|nr:N-acetyltransferase [Bacteroidia bacterium]
MEIRKVTLEDAAGISEIYNYYIENTAITFETEPVSVEEMEQRIRKLTGAGFPYYVGVIDHKIVGYYYLHEWNYRCAYSMTQEVTIYLHKDQTGKGLGSMLFDHLLQNLDRTKTHALIAGIYIPNDESVRLHEKFGFQQVSFMKEIGWKFDQWRDVGHWQLLFPS